MFSNVKHKVSNKHEKQNSFQNKLNCVLTGPVIASLPLSSRLDKGFLFFNLPE